MNFAKALVEVDEVLKYLVDYERKKIPNEVFEFITKNKDKNYKWKLDKSKKLNEQNLMEETLGILAYINMKYLLTNEQSRLMEKFYKMNDKK